MPDLQFNNKCQRLETRASPKTNMAVCVAVIAKEVSDFPR